MCVCVISKYQSFTHTSYSKNKVRVFCCAFTCVYICVCAHVSGYVLMPVLGVELGELHAYVPAMSDFLLCTGGALRSCDVCLCVSVCECACV